MSERGSFRLPRSLKSSLSSDKPQKVMEKNLYEHFDWIDYAVFFLILVVYCAIGLYLGFKDHVKQKTRQSALGAYTFLVGNQNVHVFPVAMSLVATFASGITVLGTGAEIYTYGMQYAYILAGPAMMGVFMHFIVIPVFYELKVISIFEYLEKRFDRRMRLFGSFISTLSMITWLPIVIYVPALAFNQTTGVNLHFITPLVTAVCVSYTCMGGIKAVVWTNILQSGIMYGIMLLIIIKGTSDVGGFGAVIARNWNTGRIEAPDFRFDPTIRHSFWTLFIGGSAWWTVMNTNQYVIQKFLALKDVKTARQCSMIYVVAVTIVTGSCIYIGLLLFAFFHDCDPLTTKHAKAKDQLMPLLVMNILKDMSGLPGLFIAGIFSAALSSMSSGFNAMSAVVLEDYCKPFFKRGISEQQSAIIMRSTVGVLGLASVALVYVVQNLGSVLQMSMSLPATCMGSLFGSFLIGMFLPWIGKQATFYGAILGSINMIYIVTMTQIDIAKGLVRFETKETSVEGCTYNFTSTESISTPTLDYDKQFHHISYLYYMPLGAMTTCASAFLLSFIFGFEDPCSVDPRLLAPAVRKFFKSPFVTKEVDLTTEDILLFEMKELPNR